MGNSNHVGGSGDYLPLHEAKTAKGRIIYWSYAISMVVGICFMCVYRVTHFPAESGDGEFVRPKRLAWIGLFMAELWYIFYWLITQSLRCNPVYRSTFKDRLSQRYEKVLPGIDIFVCTADAKLEPPLIVINTVLSLMAYDYPPQKLHVYLSDDGGSECMFYALWEASRFSRVWLPFCRRFNIEPRAPDVYFSSTAHVDNDHMPLKNDIASFKNQWQDVKKLYDEMRERIDETMRLERVPEELQKHHKGFLEWETDVTRNDHQTILQILVDGRDTNTVDADGNPMPTLVYLAREKRPGYRHNFKAGAMNALIRVSSRISNSPVILNVDCDQYSNNSGSIRDVLCFFMDEQQSNNNNIAYIQYPQYCHNITKNDVYGNYLRVINEIEFAGQDSNGGTLYIGSGCFHRRDALTGEKYGSHIVKTLKNDEKRIKDTTNKLEEQCKVYADCTYEENSLWGKEIGLKYGCPIEDVITGFSIQCRGWRSICFNPPQHGFLGLGPTTLMETLIQHTRWSTGQFQIFLSEYCPLVYGHGKIPLRLQISYICYNLWAVNCLATLYYVMVPSFCLLRGINLFPQLSSSWAVPHAYVIVAKYAYSLGEFISCGGTLKGWYNEQRIWLYKRLTSYLFGLCGTIMRALGFSELDFVITSKTTDEDVSRRYEKEIMEFGVASSSMFTVLATVALFNLVTFFVTMAKSVMINTESVDFDAFGLQVIINVLVVIINIPLFEGIFLRKDNGSMPSRVTYQSLAIAIFASLLALY